MTQVIAFEKRCVNYRFTTQGRDLLATMVTIPELAGQTFIELETLAEPDDLNAALVLQPHISAQARRSGAAATLIVETEA